MDAFYERLIVRAATIDELLSDDFESPRGEKGDADQAARRIAAWAQSSASGDQSLFAQRLQRDGWATDDILAKFATIRRKTSAVQPAWVQDAIWIEAALQTPGSKFDKQAAGPGLEAYPFEHLFASVIEQATERLWAGVNRAAVGNLTETARASLAHSLRRELCNFCAPAIYEQFAIARMTGETTTGRTSRYDQFIADMKSGGIRRLFEDRPVLLRLMAVITRQWLETSREFVVRLDADLPAIRRDILGSDRAAQVATIEGDLSDPHNGGRSVRIVTFADGARVVYKPKDLRLDIVWLNLIEQLNAADPPIDLKAMRAIARDGFGWTEFIDHASTDATGCKRFFLRAGAWLALFHCFVANDMHQENMIASGDYPVPIDLETILQPALDARDGSDPEAQAFDLAMEKLANSVMMVGLLPATDAHLTTRFSPSVA